MPSTESILKTAGESEAETSKADNSPLSPKNGHCGVFKHYFLRCNAERKI